MVSRIYLLPKIVFRNLSLILIFSMFPFYSFFNLFIEKSSAMYFSSKRINDG